MEICPICMDEDMETIFKYDGCNCNVIYHHICYNQFVNNSKFLCVMCRKTKTLEQITENPIHLSDDFTSLRFSYYDPPFLTQMSRFISLFYFIINLEKIDGYGKFVLMILCGFVLSITVLLPYMIFACICYVCAKVKELFFCMFRVKYYVQIRWTI